VEELYCVRAVYRFNDTEQVGEQCRHCSTGTGPHGGGGRARAARGGARRAAMAALAPGPPPPPPPPPARALQRPPVVLVYNSANRGSVTGAQVATGAAPQTPPLVAFPDEAAYNPDRPYEVRLGRCCWSQPAAGPCWEACMHRHHGCMAAAAAAMLQVSQLRVGPLPLAARYQELKDSAFGPYWVVAVGRSGGSGSEGYDWALVSGERPSGGREEAAARRTRAALRAR